MDFRTIRNISLFVVMLVLVAIIFTAEQSGQAQAPIPQPEAPGAAQLTTAFTYQGKLTQNGNPVNASCDFEFKLFDAASAGVQYGATITKTSVPVSAGLFTTTMDFGFAFTSTARWLQIGVRCPAGGGTYTTFPQRTALTAAPYALGLPLGTVISPVTGVTGQSGSGLTVLNSVATSGYTNPVAIIGAAGQTPPGYGFANGPTGVLGATDGGSGVFGYASSGFGVEGFSSSGSTTKAGVKGTNPASFGTAVFGESTGSNGTGVYGYAPNGTDAYAIWGRSTNGYAIYADSQTPCCTAAVRIYNGSDAVSLWATTSGGNAGIYGQGQAIGVVGEGTGLNSIGVVGRLSSGSTGLAGQFLGDVDVTGSILSANGIMQIDHPADAANQFLNQAYMAAPDMVNVYSGNAITDASGFATITLPDYVQALNTDFRYQLTVVGQFAQAIIASKIQNNQFVIQTDKPNVEVSWQVTGLRQDTYALNNPLVVEQAKTADQQGLYLYPPATGESTDLSLESLYRQTGQVDDSAGSPKK